MDFSLSPETEDYRTRVRAFVAEHVLPLEIDPGAYDAHENIAPAALEPLRAKARVSGLWALQMPKAERIRRWTALMDGVQEEDVIWWRKRFTDALLRETLEAA